LKVLADVTLEHLDLQGAGIGTNEVEHRFHGDRGRLMTGEAALAAISGELDERRITGAR
jgi:hypothetical protein